MPPLSSPPLSPEMKSDAVLSVSSLNKLARSLLESNFPTVLVEAEISNLVTPASGHMYLTLKDKHAQIRCAMFRNRNMLLKFRPRNGMQVLARGRLSIYEGRGDYQLIADSLEEAGDGALRRAFDELKRQLQQEGLFEQKHKQEVGDEFRHIGIVTSATGAAIRDIVSVFARRFPGIRLTLLPVAVQGDDAAKEIVSAIATANLLAEQLGIQALIVGRGGGSLEDLQAFNTEAVARALFASDLPVVSAVGHETDFTISDFVADLRAPTPSAAAELLSPDVNDALEHLQSCSYQLTQIMRSKLRDLERQLDWSLRQLKRPDRQLQEQAQSLDRLDARLRLVIKGCITRSRGDLTQRQRALVARSPGTQIVRNKDRSLALHRQFTQGISTILEQQRSKLATLSRGLNAVSPLNVLSRGYSITSTGEGQILRSVEDAAAAGQIKTLLLDGSIISSIETIQPDNNNDTE